MDIQLYIKMDIYVIEYLIGRRNETYHLSNANGKFIGNDAAGFNSNSVTLAIKVDNDPNALQTSKTTSHSRNILFISTDMVMLSTGH